MLSAEKRVTETETNKKILFIPADTRYPNPAALSDVLHYYSQFTDFTERIVKILNRKPFYRTVEFTIDIPLNIFDNLFGNLSYAVEMANLHAGKNYWIEKKNVYYTAFDGHKTRAHIYPMTINTDISRYVYFISGTYNTAIKLSGSMIMDVHVGHTNGISAFKIRTFISINNPLLASFANVMMNFDFFRSYVERIIDSTINDITRTGIRTARAIHD